MADSLMECKNLFKHQSATFSSPIGAAFRMSPSSSPPFQVSWELTRFPSLHNVTHSNFDYQPKFIESTRNGPHSKAFPQDRRESKRIGQIHPQERRILSYLPVMCQISWDPQSPRRLPIRRRQRGWEEEEEASRR